MAFRAIQAFAEHAVGDLLTDAEVIEADAHAFVVRVVDEPTKPVSTAKTDSAGA